MLEGADKYLECFKDKKGGVLRIKVVERMATAVMTRGSRRYRLGSVSDR